MSGPDWAKALGQRFRVGDLERYHIVMALCFCGHTGEVNAERLRRGRNPDTLVQHLTGRLKCTACGRKLVQHIWVNNAER